MTVHIKLLLHKVQKSQNGLWYLLWIVQLFNGFTHSYCTLCFFKKSWPGCREEEWEVILFCWLHTGLHWELPERRETCSFQIVTGLLHGRVTSDCKVGWTEWKGSNRGHLSRLNVLRKGRSHLNKGNWRAQHKVEGWMAALGLGQPMGWRNEKGWISVLCRLLQV